MTERTYLILTGLALLSFLYLELDYMIYAFIGMLTFEGLTNWRLPIIVNSIRRISNTKPSANTKTDTKLNFEAERALRLVVACMIILAFISFPDQAWFLPWFIGVMLTFAGISRFCPMVLALKWVGFK
ncbi:MAG: DUF2892 domain-containing protein [Gammaproteobacteria bacterium]|nr:DUF2892 domain-containing protein [Gammaproteobacteria bacterium]MCW8910521.1 DUF2892 domain-containing protein [Gammaproteobacteria bacterium]MCW9005613.1 DUF2892 domain-containing protein [Gammaproteobacteria bacterium]